MQLSQQQLDIVALALPPKEKAEIVLKSNNISTETSNGQIVRITAAAGTGKTTTLFSLAKRLAELGHKDITYVTFSRSAATDAKSRITKEMDSSNISSTNIHASTIHSCAYTLYRTEILKDGVKVDDDDYDDEIVDIETKEDFVHDDKISEIISRVCESQLDKFLSEAYNELSRRRNDRPSKNNSINSQIALDSAKKRCYEKASWFIFKTLQQFCRGPYNVRQFKDSGFRNRHYYPASKFHEKKGNGEEMGFPSSIYARKRPFYADQAYEIWKYLRQKNMITYDIVVKRVQLMNIMIPCSALLVDECQDMDGCQVEWVKNQSKFGTHVFYVGDAAQTIYSFRGARSKYVINVKDATDCYLTTSWRFGKSIANIANVVLYLKDNSPQTSEHSNYGSRLWNPYRVHGGSLNPCSVTSRDLTKEWKERRPVTLIARTNCTLLLHSLELLGVALNQNEEENELKKNSSCSGENYLEQVASCSEQNQLEIYFPKIHINGQGANSGLKKWQQVLKLIEHVYALYLFKGPMALPTKEFPDFHGKKTSWKEFENKVEDLELQKYIPLVYLVNSLEERTMEALNIFKEKVMIKRYKQNEADIVITTCHAAKGMEWDFVQVCPDFLETTHFQRSCNSIPVSQTTSFLEDEPPMKRQRPDSDNASNTREKWEFKVSSYDDEVNLLYVACTRAKKILSLPKNFVNLFDVLDTYHEWCSPIYRDRNRKLSSKVTEENYVSRNNNGANEFSLEHKEEIYQDICLPLRKELNVNDNQHLQSFLVDYKREEPDDKESNFIEV